LLAEEFVNFDVCGGYGFCYVVTFGVHGLFDHYAGGYSDAQNYTTMGVPFDFFWGV